jgi:hypothetical protein
VLLFEVHATIKNKRRRTKMAKNVFCGWSKTNLHDYIDDVVEADLT